jgi:nucleoside 2-deoxyribosyltransferase
MNIYFAGAIRGGRDDKALYFEIVRQLKDYGHVLTEHIGDAQLTDLGEEGSDKEIYDRDLAWLKDSDYLVAEVTIPSLGVGYEIGKATEWGRPTLCLFRPGSGRALSAMIAGSQGVIVREYESAAELKPIFDEFFALRVTVKENSNANLRSC